ncbi:MAG: cytochrome C [Methylococcus sp.]|nr:MAG: cytochrome C [Methylococcus sp.]
MIGEGATSVQASGGGASKKAPLDPQYLQECGSCHAPYPARLLSEDSWKGVMRGLNQHFGTDASLDQPEMAKAIENYLVGHARHKPTQDGDGRPLLRVTETPWFRHEHDEVPEGIWKSKSVGTPANCGACHDRAEQGTFSEHNLHMPR